MAKSDPIFREKHSNIDKSASSRYTQYRPFAYFEPKLNNRFVLYLDVEGIFVPSYLVKSVTKPSFSYANFPLQYINTITNFKGKITWNPIEIILYDPVAQHTFSPSTTSNFYVDPLSSSENTKNDVVFNRDSLLVVIKKICFR